MNRESSLYKRGAIFHPVTQQLEQRIKPRYPVASTRKELDRCKLSVAEIFLLLGNSVLSPWLPLRPANYGLRHTNLDDTTP